jgi:hypothetical protein
MGQRMQLLAAQKLRQEIHKESWQGYAIHSVIQLPV